ncbi:L-fucose mutarotase/ribose pyranase (RbsD/FucU family) [Bradyrhizobium sp. JR7.2]
MLGKLSRPEFHRAAAASFGVVQVGDSRDYGCLLIRKGVT